MVGDEDGRPWAAVGAGFCACGCGGRTPLAARTRSSDGHVKGQPVRYLRGHVTRGRKLALERRGSVNWRPNGRGGTVADGTGNPR